MGEGKTTLLMAMRSYWPDYDNVPVGPLPETTALDGDVIVPEVPDGDVQQPRSNTLYEVGVRLFEMLRGETRVKHYQQYFRPVLCYLDESPDIEIIVKQRAQHIYHDVVRWSFDRQREPDAIVTGFSNYVRAVSRAHHIVVVEDDLRDEIDRLSLYLAATFDRQLRTVHRHRAFRSVSVLASVYEMVDVALREVWASSDRERSRPQCREQLIEAPLRRWKVPVRRRPMGTLRGCLVRTPFGAAIHVNERLSPDEQSRVILHELAHLRLGHRATTELPFRPGVESLEVRKLLDRQEAEANDIADIWTHVIDGMGRYVSNPQAFWNRSKARAQARSNA